jgi:hypothetical protein
LVSNAPVGFAWNKSSNLREAIPNNNGYPESYIVYGYDTSAGPTMDSAWVSVEYNNVELARHHFWVGPPRISYISGLTVNGSTITLDPNRSYYCSALLASPLSAASSYYWTATPSWGIYITPYGSDAIISIDPYYNGYITCYASNACGAGQPYVVYISSSRSGGAPFYYPNPVDDILTIDMDAFTQQFTSGAQRKVPTYDIRLYNSYGVLVRQATSKGSNVEFNVSNLPNGLYFLHISDDINSKPEKQIIIVRH